MLAGLRHHAVIAGHHQQRVVNATHARQHVRQKLFVARHIDKPQHATVGLRPIGVPQIDRHPA